MLNSIPPIQHFAFRAFPHWLKLAIASSRVE
jgi:hypothetical protein